MTPIFALFIVFLVYAISDGISAFSKAYLSMAFVGAIIFMVGFWVGLPRTLFADSGLLELAHIIIGMFLVHIGSTLELKVLLSDWKVLVVSVVTCFGVAGGCYFIGRFFMDEHYALAAAPIAAGGNVSYLIMKSAYESLNRPDVDTFAILVLIFQALAGIPVASVLCKKIGFEVQAQYRAGTLVMSNTSSAGEPRKKLIPELPQKFQSTNMVLAKVSFLAFLGYTLSKATGVNHLVFCVIFGFIAAEIGFLEKEALIKGGSLGFVMATAFVAIFSGLANSTPEMVASLIVPLVIILIIGLACMFILGIVLAKVLKMDWKIAVIVASTAYYGFINGFVVANEVAASLSDNEEEKRAIFNYFMPKLLIGGVLSMFIVSAVAAAVMSNWF